jgi:NAD(P)-dependent dehydrogenase (short-subunit alcohol dehydrogenase family)
LGLEFCRQYAEQGDQVIATCRDPERAETLLSLAGRFSNIQINALDVSDFSQIDSLSQRLEGQSIDVQINNAGIYGDRSDVGFGHLNYDDWMRSLAVNTLAPMKMAEAFLPNLLRSQGKLIVNVSSLMGSLADNTSGGSILYRSSKAALNAAMKSLSIELKSKHIGVLILHPGWVKTDMGGSNALIDVQESVMGMKGCIEILIWLIRGVSKGMTGGLYLGKSAFCHAYLPSLINVVSSGPTC